MQQKITIDYPNFLADSLRLNREDFEKEIKFSGIIKLFENKKISSGIAAKVLNISRLDFLELAGKNEVEFLNSDDLEKDFLNA